MDLPVFLRPLLELCFQRVWCVGEARTKAVWQPSAAVDREVAWPVPEDYLRDVLLLVLPLAVALVVTGAALCSFGPYLHKEKVVVGVRVTVPHQSNPRPLLKAVVLQVGARVLRVLPDHLLVPKCLSVLLEGFMNTRSRRQVLAAKQVSQALP